MWSQKHRHRDTGQIFDSNSEVDDGNFCSLLRFKAQIYSVLKIHLQNTTIFASYISSNIKND